MIRKGYVEGCWGQVHLWTCGDVGAPAIILLHQSPLSGAMFSPAMPLLAAAGLRVIALDTPGFGMSDSPPGPVDLPEYGDALVPVFDALGLDNAILLGHHTGASIAACFAAKFPNKVSRLILNGVPLMDAEQLAYFRTYNFGPIQPVADGSHLLAAWNRRLELSPGWTDVDAMHKHVIEQLRINQTYWWGFQAALAHDIAPDLAAITCPTLIFTNTGEDLYESSKAAAALRADFQFQALQGGTHDIVDEQPANWAQVVAAFALD